MTQTNPLDGITMDEVRAMSDTELNVLVARIALGLTIVHDETGYWIQQQVPFNGQSATIGKLALTNIPNYAGDLNAAARLPIGDTGKRLDFLHNDGETPRAVAWVAEYFVEDQAARALVLAWIAWKMEAE